MLRAELLKLRRSAVWVIAPILPLMAVFTGTLNVMQHSDALDDGWASLTSQATLFYSMLFFSIGIGLLASAVWCPEHRGTNWNLLLTDTLSSTRLVLAKIAAILLPVALMQVVLVAGVVFAGLVVMRLDGAFPWQFVAAGALSILVALPLISAQSLLSMLMRSFAAPVAICLGGCVVGMATVLQPSLKPLGTVIPQALNTRVLNLGSSAIAESGALTPASVAPLILASILLTAGLVALTSWAIRAVKLR